MPPTPTTSGEEASRGTPSASGRVGEGAASVGEYDLIRQIGAGGLGLVFLARHRGLHREVALKILRLPPGARDEVVQRFLREARAAARLSHPGIAPVYEAGQDGDALYYAMELVDGGSLAEAWSATRKPTPRQALEWIGQAARALAHAHAAGVIHRDIKPQNLLLGRDGRIRLVDFGLAKDLDAKSELTQEGQVLGTPAYMSPEQAEGAVATLGPATDVYSLGAVLYFLLSGVAPFEGETPFSVVKKVILDPVVPIRRRAAAVTRDIQTLCMKCLEKDPAHRYASAAALADDVEAFLDGVPISARPPGPIERAVRFARRHGGATLAVAAVVLSVAAALLDRQMRGMEQAQAAARERDRQARFRGLAQAAAERLRALDHLPISRFSAGLTTVAEELDRALEIDPDAGSVRLLRSEIAWLALDPERAARDLEHLRTRHGDDAAVEYAHVRLDDALLEARLGEPIPGFRAAAERSGVRLRARTDSDLGARARLRHALRHGRAREAAAELASLQAAPSATDAADDLRLRAAAQAYRAEVEPEQRLTLCDELVRTAPRRFEAYRLRASVLQELGRARAAAEDWRTCLALQPGKPLRVDLDGLCRALFDAAADPGDGEYRQALEQVVEAYPEDPAAWRWLVTYHRRAGNLDAADAAALRWEAVQSHPLVSVRERYELALARGGAAAAAAFLDRSLAALRPEEVVVAHGGDAVSSLTDALREAKRADAARDLLERCRRVAPDDPFLAWESAETYMALGRAVEAVEGYTTAIAAWPTNADLYQRRARAQRKAKDRAAMEKDLRRAVELDPANPRYRSRWAVALLLAGRGDQALDQLVESIYRTPTLQVQQRLYRWMAGEFEDDSPQPVNAAVDPQKALAASFVRPLLPRVAGRLIERGVEALEQGDSLRVLRNFSAAALVNPESPTAYVHLARFHVREQAWLAAVQCLERAVELGFQGVEDLAADPDLRDLLWFPEIRRWQKPR